MAVKCKGKQAATSCAVRYTCLHWLGQVLGDELHEPKTDIGASGCAGYKKMSLEAFKDDYRKNFQPA